ncbi:MAG: hypothetical protein FWC97_01225 [Treponema sp.]|nr:hypothetical protein [Treponema sp.]
MKKKIITVFFLILFHLLLAGCPGTENEIDGFSLNLEQLTFEPAGEGYTTRFPQNVYVTNHLGELITVNINLSGANPGSFSVNTNSLSIAAGATARFTVRPIRGLNEGTYSATIIVSADGFLARSVNLSFTVTEEADEFHVFLAFGQSNMQGPGPIRQRDSENVSERWKVLNVVAGIYGGQTRAQGEWYTAVPPLMIAGNLNHWQHPFTTGLSPADWFGRHLAANIPERITVGVIPVAHGDLALAAFHRTRAEEYYFGPSGQGGDHREPTRPSTTERTGWERYTNAGYESLFDAIVSNAKIAQEQGAIIKGIIVHQGESGRGLTYTTWHEMLKEIYDDILSELGLAPNSIPILLGQTWDAGSGNTGDMLNLDFRIQQTIPNAWIISSELLTQGRPVNDFLHFGSEDLEEFGIRYAETMLNLLYR